ncbi:MAG TPA: Gfo/Idh/MocA family oxidoreductase [Ferruginibacter sp.]|nr:Gfo/Idh/MocA family oxidoreductase [Ferruginibacter sp.]HMP20103.1 Gfo/Idh/MocA family oxidoreductase [Ferruginibacter sp.]
MIHTALLSFGMSGRVFHAPFIHLHPGFHLTGSWERSTQSIKKVYPGTTSYPSLEAVLADDAVQLVVVNTPTCTHYGYAKQALAAGKDVIVEKAFTTTVAEAKELHALAEKLGRKISVFQNRRWDSDFKTVLQVKQQHLLGDIIDAEIHFDRYKAELSPKLHKEIPQPGAGTLNDLGPHVIDQALCLFGLPQAVFADIRTTRPQSQVDDWFDIQLFYPSLRVRLRAGLLMREPSAGFILHGTRGSFIKSRADVQETQLQAGKLPCTANWGTEPETESGLLHTEIDGKIIRQTIPTLQGNYYDYYDAVQQAITQNIAMPVTALDGIRVMSIIEAAQNSSRAKKVITL